METVVRDGDREYRQLTPAETTWLGTAKTGRHWVACRMAGEQGWVLATALPLATHNRLFPETEAIHHA